MIYIVMSILTKEKIPSHYKSMLLEEKHRFNSRQLLILFIFILVLSIIMLFMHSFDQTYLDNIKINNLFIKEYIGLTILSLVYFLNYGFYIKQCKKLKVLGRIVFIYLILVTLSINFITFLVLLYGGYDTITFFGLLMVLSTVLWLKLSTYLFLNIISMTIVTVSIILSPFSTLDKINVIPGMFILYLLGWLFYFNNRKIRRDEFLHRKLMEVYNQRLLEKSMVEPMTGFYNRRTMEEGLKKVNAIHNRANKQYCLMLIDIDYFKKINDTLGHLIGDSVIKETSKIIKNEMRESDIGYRYGGEEFLFVLNNTKLEEGKVLAERIRKSIQQNDFADVNWQITVSIGLVENILEITPLELVDLADKCLYKAKESGRNRVVS